MRAMHRFFAIVSILALLPTGILSTGCAASTLAGGANHSVQMAPLDMLPQEMQDAPSRVREAYQFAVANPGALQNVPCYCGCGAIGHASNYSCFVKNTDSNGKAVFDQHALGCSLCVDIAQDVLRLTKEGKSPGDIKSFVISNYSRFGPPNQ